MQLSIVVIAFTRTVNVLYYYYLFYKQKFKKYLLKKNIKRKSIYTKKFRRYDLSLINCLVDSPQQYLVSEHFETCN